MAAGAASAASGGAAGGGGGGAGAGGGGDAPPEIEAFSMVPLISNVITNAKIECLAKAGEFVFVGTSDGKVCQYQIISSAASDDEDAPYSYCARSQEGLTAAVGGSKKRVEQLIAAPSISKVIALCDGHVTVLELDSMAPVANALAVRGAQMLAANEVVMPRYRLLVASKKKVQLFEYRDRRFHAYQELTLFDVPVQIVWVDHAIVVGFRREYNVIDDQTGAPTTITSGLDRHATPMLKLLPDGEVLLAALEREGIFVDLRGQPVPRQPVAWTDTPIATAYCFPYLISVVGRQLEVHLVHGAQAERVQTVRLPSPLSDSNICSMVDGGLVDGQRRPRSDPEDYALIATTRPSCVYLLQRSSFGAQARAYLRQGCVAEAERLVELTAAGDGPARAEKLRGFHVQAACALLGNLDFAGAVQHVLAAGLDPRELLAYYPHLLPASSPVPLPRPQHLTPELLLGSADAPLSIEAVVAAGVARGRPAPAGAGTQAADDALVPLLQARARGSSVVDTALLKLYVARRRLAELEALVDDPASACDLLDAKAMLVEGGMFHALALLYRANGLAKEALDVWAKLGSGEYQEDGRDGVQETLDFLADGAAATEDLIWEYSETLLNRQPDKALRVFFNRTAHATDGSTTAGGVQLAPERVLEHLEAFDKSSGGTFRLCLRYLEHLVADKGCVDEAINTRLAREYVATVLRLMEGESAAAGQPHDDGSGARPAPGSEGGLLGDVRGKLYAFLDTSTAYRTLELLEAVRHTQLLEESVLLYSRANQHEQALNVLLYELGDSDAAERYCLAGDVGPLLLQLLSIYLHPSSERQRNAFSEAAIRLLDRHAARIPPVQVIEMLPESMPLSRLRTYLSRVITNSTHRRRDGQVVKNLAKVQNRDVAVERAELRQREVRILGDTRCAVCFRTIRDIVFAVYPNEVVAHYKCVKGDLRTCPVTGARFEEGAGRGVHG